MKIELTPNEARIIGCLIEKAITTPDQYPLSLNALVNACNQKTNRDPVTALDATAVQQTLDALAKKYLVAERAGERVPKYKHRFCNTGFGSLELSDQELGIICVLLLRGPQTPGELRTRTARLCKFEDVEEVEATLKRLATREEGPFVARLPREPGKREARYAHLLGHDSHTHVAASPDAALAEPAGDEHQRLTDLERIVEDLRQELQEVKGVLATLTDRREPG